MSENDRKQFANVWSAHLRMPQNRNYDNSVNIWGGGSITPTLQMNLVFRALHQNGTDRVQVVIVTASERACPCFGHLKGRQRHMAIIGTL